MKTIVQRVTSASVIVDNQLISEIGSGCLILVGIEKSDDAEIAKKLANKISRFRFFSDDDGKMNLNIKQFGGEALVVSQFTLVADTQKGNRPGFSLGASPEQGRLLYRVFADELASLGIATKTGRFGADMQVQLINDGPVTFSVNS